MRSRRIRRGIRRLNEARNTTIKDLKEQVDYIYKRYGGKVEIMVNGNDDDTVSYLSVSLYTPNGDYYCGADELMDGLKPSDSLEDDDYPGLRVGDLHPVVTLWTREY